MGWKCEKQRLAFRRMKTVLVFSSCKYRESVVIEVKITVLSVNRGLEKSPAISSITVPTCVHTTNGSLGNQKRTAAHIALYNLQPVRLEDVGGIFFFQTHDPKATATFLSGGYSQSGGPHRLKCLWAG